MSGYVIAILGGIGFAALAVGLIAFFRDGELGGWRPGRRRASAGPSAAPSTDEEPAARETVAAASPLEVSYRRPTGPRRAQL